MLCRVEENSSKPIIITIWIKTQILFHLAIPLTEIHHMDIFSWKYKDINMNIHCSSAVKNINILQ